jgi:hypothetical protein
VSRDRSQSLARLIEAIKRPGVLAGFSDLEWAGVLAAGEATKLAGRLVEGAATCEADLDAPGRRWLADRLTARRAISRQYERSIRWEIGRVRRALLNAPAPWVLLKGAAYVAAALPMASGRSVSDIDILVPESALPDVEARLQNAGWEFAEISDYDRRYYREWMHELPPMVHPRRRSALDVHHAILPKTSRLHTDPDRLLERARELPGGLRVLAPSDMVIHSAVHMFHDGEIAGGLRDLVDLDGLLRHFDSGEFWRDLIEETDRHGVQRPVYYALLYAKRYLETPLPDTLTGWLRCAAPPRAVGALMDVLVHRALLDGQPGSGLAVQALYVRSHWLKMPPVLLTRHLARKLFTGGWP